MFYQPAKMDHGLAHDPFKNLIAPRPIGWISTQDKDGRANLAPFSFFNAIATGPHLLAFAPGGNKDDGTIKDSLRNIRETGVFIHNLVSFDLKDQMNLSSGTYAHGVDEFALAGLTALPGHLVKAPRVKEAAAHLECKLWKIIDLPCHDPEGYNALVIGEVVGIHLDEAYIKNGRFDISALKLVARLGYMDYTMVETIFSMTRPEPEA